jgi:uncharacterized membrane protein YsdA (DUF1294 family)
MQWGNPFWRFSLLSFVSALLLTFGISFVLSPPLAWLVAINLVAIATYRYDKLIAGSQRTRVPERVLLLQEAFGGTLGAAIAMWLIRPRHKTKSWGFLLWFGLIFLLQVAVAAVVYFGLGNVLPAIGRQN